MSAKRRQRGNLRVLPDRPREVFGLNEHARFVAREISSGRARAVFSVVLRRDGDYATYMAGEATHIEASGMAVVLADHVRARVECNPAPVGGRPA